MTALALAALGVTLLSGSPSLVRIVAAFRKLMPSRYTSTGRVLFLGEQPRDPTLALWFRRGVDMFTDTAATVPANTGDAVAAWQSGEILAIQATLGNRPVRQPGGELLFGGVTDSIQFLRATNDATLMRVGFTVAVWVDPAAAVASRIIVGRDTTSGNTIREWYLLSNPVFAVAASSGGLVSTGSGSGLATGWHLVIGTFDGTRVRVSLDGADPGIGAEFLTSLAAPAPAEPMSISSSVGGRQYNARYGDVRIWHQALSADDIATLFAAERGSYGV